MAISGGNARNLVSLINALRRVLALLGELGELGLLPLAAAGSEDAFEEDGGGFGVGVLRPPVLGEFALDRRLEDGGSIPLQVSSHPLQGGDPGIEVGEKFFDLGDDAALLSQGGEWNLDALDLGEIESGPSDTVDNLRGALAGLLEVQSEVEIPGKSQARVWLDTDTVCLDYRCSYPIGDHACPW